MKCMTCEADIPSAWVAALASNNCPGCAGPIYSEQSKELMDELRTAMSAMKNADAESIAGWILDNYQLVKIGSGEPVNFHRKLPASNINQKVAEKLHPKLKPKRETEKNFRDIVAEINSGNLGGINEDNGSVDIDLDNELPFEIEDTPTNKVANYIAFESGPVDPIDLKLKNIIEKPQLLLAGDQKPLSADELSKLTSSISKVGESKHQTLLDAKRLEKLRKQTEILNGTADETEYAKGAIRRA